MKNKLRILGVGALIALRSCAGVVFLIIAIWGGVNVPDASGYVAVIVFLASVILLIYSLKTIYHIGGLFAQKGEE